MRDKSVTGTHQQLRRTEREMRQEENQDSVGGVPQPSSVKRDPRKGFDPHTVANPTTVSSKLSSKKWSIAFSKWKVILGFSKSTFREIVEVEA